MLKVICVDDQTLDIKIPATGQTERWETTAKKGIIYSATELRVNKAGLLCYRFQKNDALACRFVEIEQDIVIVNK